jgi:MGT family glycosyltransferase
MRAVVEAGATGIELAWEPDPSMLSQEFSFGSLLATLEEFVGAARRAFPGLVEYFQRNRPDLVCSDAVVLGPMLAGVFGAPRVSLVPTFVSNKHFSPREIVPGFSPVHPRLAAYGASVAAFAADYDLPASIDIAGMQSALTLVFLPREFQIAGDTFDDTYRFIGPSVGHRAHSAAWQPPGDSSPVLFVSLGTAFNDRPDFFALCAEAFHDTDWHVVIAIGDRTNSAAIGPLPANVEIARYFPQPTVLSHARAFVSHAGMNSTMEALYHQVPLIAVPQMHEQFVIANRVEELGLGRLLDSHATTAQQLRDTVEHVAADPTIRTHLVAMKQQLDSAGGAMAGADAVEHYLGLR